MMTKATMGAEAILMFGEGEVALRQKLRIAWAGHAYGLLYVGKNSKTGKKKIKILQLILQNWSAIDFVKTFIEQLYF